MAKPTLTLDQVAKLKTAQKNLNDFLPTFDDMEACGQDCQQFRQLFADQSSKITELLTRFSPKGKLTS